MTLDRVHVGDIVHCDVKGRQFYALVTSREPGEPLGVRPITHNTSYRTVTALQVNEHFRCAGTRAASSRRQRQEQEVAHAG